MKELNSHCRLAIVQAAPVMFDKDACLEKAIRLIEEAAQNGAELIVFPELFLPGYPYGMTFGYTVGSRKEPGRADWKIYYDNSILSDGAEMQQLIDCAKRLDVYLSFGYSERDAQTATLYNSNMLISPQGQALNHRKLKPTGAERLCDVTRSVSKMTEIERRGGKRWDKPKKAGKSRDCRGGKF